MQWKALPLFTIFFCLFIFSCSSKSNEEVSPATQQQTSHDVDADEPEGFSVEIDLPAGWYLDRTAPNLWRGPRENSFITVSRLGKSVGANALATEYINRSEVQATRFYAGRIQDHKVYFLTFEQDMLGELAFCRYWWTMIDGCAYRVAAVIYPEEPIVATDEAALMEAVDPLFLGLNTAVLEMKIGPAETPRRSVVVTGLSDEWQKEATALDTWTHRDKSRNFVVYAMIQPYVGYTRDDHFDGMLRELEKGGRRFYRSYSAENKLWSITFEAFPTRNTWSRAWLREFESEVVLCSGTLILDQTLPGEQGEAGSEAAWRKVLDPLLEELEEAVRTLRMEEKQ